MRAITRYQYGQADVLQIKEIEIPKPKKSEILIRVHCTTVNRTDCSILMGKPFLVRLFTGLLTPSSEVPGTDFAGEVMQIGDQVKKFKVGDRVWGLNDQGLASQAEFMKIDENGPVALIPGNTSYDHAVASAEGAHYAYNFINKISLQKGDKVLVNGATGAIGSAALQLLKSLDLYVTAVGNAQNRPLLKSLGADKIFDFEKEDFTEVDDERYNFIFDTVGKSSFAKCKKLLLPNGIYLSSELGPHGENLYLPLVTRLKRGKKVIFPIPQNCKRSLNYVGQLLEVGKFKAIIDRYYQPEEIKKAYHYVQSGRKTGNVIIRFFNDQSDIAKANKIEQHE
jgi:NADPH:quinone reductase-like Zn-dependent oxidoreductase